MRLWLRLRLPRRRRHLSPHLEVQVPDLAPSLVVRHEVERRAAGRRGHGIGNQLLHLCTCDERLERWLAKKRQLVGVLVVEPHMSFEVLEQLLAARALQHLLGCLRSAVRGQHAAVFVPGHASLCADAR